MAWPLAEHMKLESKSIDRPLIETVFIHKFKKYIFSIFKYIIILNIYKAWSTKMIIYNKYT